MNQRKCQMYLETGKFSMGEEGEIEYEEDEVDIEDYVQIFVF